MNEVNYEVISYIDNNSIKFNTTRFGWSQAVDVFKKIYQLKTIDGFSEIVLDFTNLRTIHPDGIVPLINAVNRFRDKESIKFKLIQPLDKQTSEYAERLAWFHYLDPDNFPISDIKRYNKFALNSFHNVDELNKCINSAIDICLEQLVFAEGVPQAFEWALNELAGNILVHSGSNSGWLQILTNKTRHRLSITLCDSGVGIPYNIKNVFKNINVDRIAIEHALKKGVTSNPKQGQGNGLAGSLAIAQASDSYLTITSGRGRVEVLGGRIKSMRYFPPTYGTIVNMDFNTENPIDLPKTLWGYEPTSYFELKYENEQGDLEFKLKDHSQNFGNRPTGERIRNLIDNLLKQNPGRAIIIKMDDVEIIASSFADELFGKLATDLGIIDFSSYIKLKNVNTLCKSIIDVAIKQRIAQNFDAEHITKINDFK